MGISHIAAVVAAISLGWLPQSCTKSTTAKSAPSAGTASATPANTKNLGQVTLTNHYETRIDIGAGQSCLITPRLVDGRNLQLTLALESKQADGKIGGLSVAQTSARSGQRCDIKIGDLAVTMTPNFVDGN